MLDNGFFPDGPEPILWRPDLDHAGLRRQGVVESMLPEAGPFALIGLTIAFLTGSAIGIIVAALVLALSGLAAMSAYRCFGLDCTRPGWMRHRRDRGAGEWFYRPGDFAALPKDCRDRVDKVFAALAVFDEPQVLDWLEADCRREAHTVAWQLLDCLHATLPTRALLARVTPDLADDGVVTLVRYELVRLDTAVSVAVDGLCETSALLEELAVRVTAPRRRAGLRADLRCVRLPSPPAVGELAADVRSRVRAVHEVLDLAGTMP
jgi:hypothetical protein